MPYLIYDIKDFDPQEYPLYYCDANVWIAALKFYGIGGANNYELPYQNFFDALVNLNENNDPAIQKRIKNKPKIVLTSLVLSEIINAFMRQVAMKSYFGGDNEYKKWDFKKDYRDNPLSDYKAQLSNLCSDIVALSNYTILMNDDFDTIAPFSFLLDLPNVTQDFNDLYYNHFLKRHSITYVTNDKDCKFEDIRIVTANKSLLRYTSIQN